MPVIILLTSPWKTVSSGQPSFCMVFKLTHYENHIHTLPQFSFLFWRGWGRGVVVVLFSCLAYRRECFLQLGSFSLVLLSDSHIMSEIATHTPLLNEKYSSRRQTANCRCCELCLPPLSYFVTCRSWSNYLALKGHSFCGVCNHIYSTFY